MTCLALPGKAVYTQLCNEKGGIEADVTLVHVGPDHFYLITGSGFGVRDSGWVAKHLPPSVQIREVTNALAVINICGPRSREILQSVTDADISNAALSVSSGRGRLMWVMQRCWRSALATWASLVTSFTFPRNSAPMFMTRYGRRAQPMALPMRGTGPLTVAAWRRGISIGPGDISPDYNPYEAGLGFCVALDKGDFIGREALVKIKSAGLSRKLCSFTIDGFAPLHGGETILHGGKVVGSTTSVGYGHTSAKTIAFGYLPMEIAESKRLRHRSLWQSP